MLARIKGEEDSEPVVTLGSNFEHAFTESTKITNKFLAEAGSDNTAVQNDLCAAGEHERDAGAGRGHSACATTPIRRRSRRDTDTQFTVNLVYNIK